MAFSASCCYQSNSDNISHFLIHKLVLCVLTWTYLGTLGGWGSVKEKNEVALLVMINFDSSVKTNQQ